MYFTAAEQGYHLVGKPMDLPMKIGMPLIVIGFLATIYSLLPRAVEPEETIPRVRAMDDVSLNWMHLQLILVMVAAITIDVMKPTTLSFVLPGFAREYGLQSPVNPDGTIPASLLPLAGITGTVLGSFIWGWMGDRIGRRDSMLLAGVSFAATAICGSMPTWQMNVFMCFVMGLGAGGMLPIIFTLISETIPARHRGWVMVLIGGDVAAAYIITSWLSSVLVPLFSWRILWLIGLPTGLLLVFLSRWIPESPRYLLAQGRSQEARAVMEKYGAEIVEEEEETALEVEENLEDRYGQLFLPPYLSLTTAAVLVALGIGLVTFGFQLWIPSNLQSLGFTEGEASRLLRDSALIGFPLNFVVAGLYGFWSSKRTLVGLVGLTTASMIGFLLVGDSVVSTPVLLYTLLLMPIWGISSVTAVLSAYVAEIYPTRVRSRGSGLIAGMTKAGGVLVIGVVTLSISPPSIAGTALIGAVPMGLATVAVAVFGIETCRRRLEDITSDQVGRRAPQAMGSS
jgi:putative MFS transporter